MVATAFIATHRSSGEAFAQGSGTERRVVGFNAYSSSQGYYSLHYAYRLWSDNSVDMRCLGFSQGAQGSCSFWPTESGNFAQWLTVDNGTSGFRPLTDVDMSGETDAGDISQVLLDFNTRSDDLPPPPIDCTINAPR